MELEDFGARFMVAVDDKTNVWGLISEVNPIHLSWCLPKFLRAGIQKLWWINCCLLSARRVFYTFHCFVNSLFFYYACAQVPIPYCVSPYCAPWLACYSLPASSFKHKPVLRKLNMNCRLSKQGFHSGMSHCKTTVEILSQSLSCKYSKRAFL